MATLGDGKDGGKSVQISEANNASNFTLIFVIGFCSSAQGFTQTFIFNTGFGGEESDIEYSYQTGNLYLLLVPDCLGSICVLILSQE